MPLELRSLGPHPGGRTKNTEEQEGYLGVFYLIEALPG